MEARPTLLKRILGDPRNALKKNLGNLRNAFKKILGKLRNAWGGLIVLLANWLVFIAALLALVFGVWLLVLVSHGTPVAAAFTRVGGPTRVETAVAASRFWLTPPSQFVTIPADAEEKIILRAAQYAMTHDAPLLFTSRTPRRQWLVRMTIHNWRDDAKARHLPRPARVNAQDLPNGKVCPANPAAADSLANRLAGNRLDQTLRHEFAVEMNGGVLDWLITGPTGPVPNIQSLVVKPNY